MSKVIAFIPARGGSVSIPKKNIKIFCGKPLIFWNIYELNKCDEVNEIWVATDSQEIAETALSFHVKKVKIFKRSAQNAQAHSSTESVILEFLTKESFKDETIFILSQATNPFTRQSDYQNGLKLLKHNEFDSVLSVVRKKSFYWNENGTSINYDYENRPRRQEFRGILQENGAFYISKVKDIQQSKNRLSGKIGFIEMPRYSSIELDEQDDWDLATFYMRKNILPKIHSGKDIKILVTDVDGVLTDAGMYYTENGDELKKFNTRDGMGFELLRNAGIKTAIITSEESDIVIRRAKKLKVDYLKQGSKDKGKLSSILEICSKENLDLANVAYVGDDVNCIEALERTGLAACPADAVQKVKNIPGIVILQKKGGEGVVRELIEDYILK